jgi:2-polyprenyl-3-methyl-5-hydroxy-6-metoxy-1,4-benzoquinol methylase
MPAWEELHRTQQTALSECSHPEPDQRVLFAARDYISGDPFTVKVCRLCSLVRTHPHPMGEDMQRYYPLRYYGSTKRYLFPIDYMLNRRQATWAARIHERHANRPGTALDCGCGQGLLLHGLRERGWNVVGTELTDEAARFARSVLSLNVLVGDLSDLQLKDGAYDVIILRHVLEHVDDPAGVLREARRRLRNGGLVLVAVPNFGSVEAGVWKRHWFHLDVPRHVTHFTPTTLRRLLEEAQFRCEDSSYFSPEFDYFSFIQSALNALGFGQNSLYELLRVPPAKFVRRRRARRYVRDVIASATLGPILAMLALVWVPIAAAMNRGATVVVYARKV